MTKLADIMAAVQGRLANPTGDFNLVWIDESGMTTGWPDTIEEARAIVTAVNLFPLYEAVREAAAAARRTAEPDDDFDGNFIEYLVDAEAFDRLRAALDALQAAEDAL